MADRPERPRCSPPGPAPKEGLEYFRFRGLRTGFDYRDVWQEEHALAFTVVISFHPIYDGWPYVERLTRTAETGQDGQEVLRNALPAPKGDGTAPGSPAGPPGGLQNSTAR